MPGDLLPPVRTLLLCALLLFASACAGAPPTAPPVELNIYSTPAAAPWLGEAFKCAAGRGTLLNVSASSAGADLALRVGEPAGLLSPSFQIDSEEILVVTNQQSPLKDLGLESVRQLFAGQGDASVQVWVYSPGDDIQQSFDRLVMQGEALTSQARLAVSPQQMSDTLNAQANTVGILSRHWMTGSAWAVFSAGTVPVLAITSSDPSGPLQDLVACLQE
jgi:hypothetical protein